MGTIHRRTLGFRPPATLFSSPAYITSFRLAAGSGSDNPTKESRRGSKVTEATKRRHGLWPAATNKGHEADRPLWLSFSALHTLL